MSESQWHRNSTASSSASNRPQVEQLLGLRRDTGADGGGGEGGRSGGGEYDSDGGGEDTGVARLWRRAFSGLKLAKDKSNKKKKDSSMESEDIDPVYSLLKHAADRGTQKCQASCCSQPDRAASPSAYTRQQQQPQQQQVTATRRNCDQRRHSNSSNSPADPFAKDANAPDYLSGNHQSLNTLTVPLPNYASDRKFSLPTPDAASVSAGADRRRLDQRMKSVSVDTDRAGSLAPPSPRSNLSPSLSLSPSPSFCLSPSPSGSGSPSPSPIPTPHRRRSTPRASTGRELPTIPTTTRAMMMAASAPMFTSTSVPTSTMTSTPMSAIGSSIGVARRPRRLPEARRRSQLSKSATALPSPPAPLTPAASVKTADSSAVRGAVGDLSGRRQPPDGRGDLIPGRFRLARLNAREADCAEGGSCLMDNSGSDDDNPTASSAWRGGGQADRDCDEISPRRDRQMRRRRRRRRQTLAEAPSSPEWWLTNGGQLGLSGSYGLPGGNEEGGLCAVHGLRQRQRSLCLQPQPQQQPQQQQQQQQQQHQHQLLLLEFTVEGQPRTLHVRRRLPSPAGN